jgi:hypothetical protein
VGWCWLVLNEIRSVCTSHDAYVHVCTGKCFNRAFAGEIPQQEMVDRPGSLWLQDVVLWAWA